LAIDPGETTGVAVFENGNLTARSQLKTKEYPEQAMLLFLDQVKPTQIVCENYMVYGHKTSAHSWSMLHTPKLIGAINMWCTIHDIPIHMQMAATAKPFCTNAKLKEWGLWAANMRHADDAIRHGCYYLIFHKEA